MLQFSLTNHDVMKSCSGLRLQMKMSSRLHSPDFYPRGKSPDTHSKGDRVKPRALAVIEPHSYWLRYPVSKEIFVDYININSHLPCIALSVFNLFPPSNTAYLIYNFFLYISTLDLLSTSYSNYRTEDLQFSFTALQFTAKFIKISICNVPIWNESSDKCKIDTFNNWIMFNMK